MEKATNEQIVEGMLDKIKELETENDKITATIEEKRKKITQRIQGLNLSIREFATKKKEE